MPGWFSAAVVFEISVNGEIDGQRSISLLVVRAGDEREAGEAALAHGRAEEVNYKNSEGEPVTWRCTEVLLAEPILDDELTEGTEVYSCFVSADLLDAIRSQTVGEHSLNTRPCGGCCSAGLEPSASRGILRRDA